MQSNNYSFDLTSVQALLFATIMKIIIILFSTKIRIGIRKLIYLVVFHNTGIYLIINIGVAIFIFRVAQT